MEDTLIHKHPRRTAFHTYEDTRADIDLVVNYYRKKEGPHVTFAMIARRYFKEDAERIRMLQS